MLWRLPAAGSIKVNVDGGLFQSNKRICIGVVIRNDVGQFMAAMTHPFLTWHDPLTVELLAIFEALKFFHHAGFHSGELVADSICAVQLIQSCFPYYGSNYFLMQDIKNLLSVEFFFFYLLCPSKLRKYKIVIE